jgi:hypothetical protein
MEQRWGYFQSTPLYLCKDGVCMKAISLDLKISEFDTSEQVTS